MRPSCMVSTIERQGEMTNLGAGRIVEISAESWYDHCYH